MATTAIGIRAARELDELYRAHAAEVYRYAYAVLGNQADAEDVTQTTFVNALRALERGERPRKPTNWLITIAHNLIRQRWRQEQSRPHEVALDRDVASLEADDDGPAIGDLVRALQRIPASQREALVLREMEGRSYKEIATILDVSLTALETLIFRARRSLAEELENLVTCDLAELALSKQSDGRLGRKERRRLVAHLEECSRCARVAALGMKRRRAFKGIALLPLPLSLTLFKGAPSASAAIGLPTIGASAAAGGGAAGVVGAGITAKIAIGLTAVAVAGGAGYEGVKRVQDPLTPAASARTAPTKLTPIAPTSAAVSVSQASPTAQLTKQQRATSAAARAKAAGKKPPRAEVGSGGRSASASVRGRSAEALARDRKAKAPAGAAAASGRSVEAPGKTRAAEASAKAGRAAAASGPDAREPAKGARTSTTAPGPTKPEPKRKPDDQRRVVREPAVPPRAKEREGVHPTPTPSPADDALADRADGRKPIRGDRGTSAAGPQP